MFIKLQLLLWMMVFVLLATRAQLRTSEHYPALPLQVMNSFPGCKMLVFCGFLKGR